MAFPGGLSSLAAEAEISDAGKQARGTLADEIKTIDYGTFAWTALVMHLFETSSYLRRSCQEATPVGAQKRSGHQSTAALLLTPLRGCFSFG